MSEKRDIESNAKTLIESSPDEAVTLYKKLWEDYSEDFNAWDAFFSMKALRKSNSLDLDFIDNILNRFPEDEKVKGLYGWIIFDHFIKGKSKQQLLDSERRIVHMCNLVDQKDRSSDDKYPCPVNIAVFNLADAYSENLFSERKVNEWLSRINPDLLSAKTRTIITDQRGDIEIASDLEKYYALKTKALLKLGEYEGCKNLCEIGISRIDNFHYNNDLWLKMRIAICEEKLGNLETSEHLFQELLHTKAGSDKWFLYRDIAELYNEQKNYQKAWKYAVDAAFYGNEPHFLINLYLLQARILFKLNRPDEGKVLALLIAAILAEQGWKNKDQYNRLFNYYGIDLNNVEPVKDVFRRSKEFWIQERYKNLKPIDGKIIFVHKNNKVGRIKTQDGVVYDFHRRDFAAQERNLQNLKGADVKFIPMPSYDGHQKAERIKVSSRAVEQGDNIAAGLILMGTIKSVVDFGLFIRFEKYRDGLLHKNALPHEIRDSYLEKYRTGDRITVKIIEENEKGLKLGFVKENNT
jgi:hypothetical protein